MSSVAGLVWDARLNSGHPATSTNFDVLTFLNTQVPSPILDLAVLLTRTTALLGTSML